MAGTKKRKKRLVPEKTQNRKPMYRDTEMVFSVFTHRLLRTTHLLDLFSGGDKIATLEPGTEGLLIGGPAVIADERFFKLQIDGADGRIEGWISEDSLALPGPPPARSQRLKTKTIGFIRPRPGGSPQNIRKRARLLMDHDLLQAVEEPESVLRRRRRDRIPGSLPRIYGVGDKGADGLAETYALERGKVRWREKNRELGDDGLGGKKHILASADAIVPIIASCQLFDNIEYVPPPDVLRVAPLDMRRTKSPYMWRVDFRSDKRKIPLSATPDKLFALRFAEKTDDARVRYFLMEADRGTEPLERKKEDLPRQSSLGRKLLTYGVGHRQRYHQKRFNIPNFRCLIVTTSATRVKHMMELVKQLGQEFGIPVNLFYFTHYQALKRDMHNALAHKWLTWDGRKRVIREITLLD